MHVERTKAFTTSRSYDTKYINDRDAVRRHVMESVATDLARQIVDSEFAQFTESERKTTASITLTVTLCITSPGGQTGRSLYNEELRDRWFERWHTSPPSFLKAAIT